MDKGRESRSDREDGSVEGMMKVTADTNFLRLFEMPQKFPSGFCFGGGYPVRFQMVDWFGPIDPQLFWEKKEIDLDSDLNARKQEQLRTFIKEKLYYKLECKYLAITDYGDAFII
jgi:hypothetical protein